MARLCRVRPFNLGFQQTEHLHNPLNEGKPATLDAFIEGATEHKGSWWPDWIGWLAPLSGERVDAVGARVPGEGKLRAIEDAPGSYVRAR